MNEYEKRVIQLLKEINLMLLDIHRDMAKDTSKDVENHYRQVDITKHNEIDLGEKEDHE